MSEPDFKAESQTEAIQMHYTSPQDWQYHEENDPYFKDVIEDANRIERIKHEAYERGRTDEREACAKMCEDWAAANFDNEQMRIQALAASTQAYNIRARSEAKHVK